MILTQKKDETKVKSKCIPIESDSGKKTSFLVKKYLKKREKIQKKADKKI